MYCAADTNLAKFLRKIITDELLDHSSWTSFTGKFNLAELKIFSHCLYNIWIRLYVRHKLPDPKHHFQNEMKKAIKTARNRIHQRRHKLKYHH